MKEIQYNYQFCFRGIKQAFFFFTTMYPDKFSDEKFAQGIFEAAVDFCERKIRKGFIERYGNIKLDCFINKKNFVGYAFELNDAKKECECNYVAMVLYNGKYKLYTNEYYEFDNSFGLSVNHKGVRASLKLHPKTFEEFKKEILVMDYFNE